jgi:hypothetical protein
LLQSQDFCQYPFGYCIGSDASSITSWPADTAQIAMRLKQLQPLSLAKMVSLGFCPMEQTFFIELVLAAQKLPF